ncbi:MAG: 30S ribosomal protein S9 [Spirochaetaceae bacterium]|nr:MAG: 30S ribosomal protein S9 [Spirochaetaceae bacterium]
MIKNLAQGTGRRKTSVARVILRSGNGAIVVNELPIETFFPQRTHRLIIGEPLEVTNNTNKVDIQVNVSGGGISGQADAIRHGIARALVKLDVTNTSTLRANGMLTRDPRMVERKKYGRSGARKRFQFSKR